MNRRQQLLRIAEEIYSAALGRSLIGILFTGSAGMEQGNRHSDVDYIIFVEEFTAKVVKRMSVANADFQKCVGDLTLGVSLATREMVARLANWEYVCVDPKIVQAIIQCKEDDYWARSGFELPALSDETIRRFSRDDYFKIMQLMVKTLVRAGIDMGISTKIKALKLNRILLKLYRQAVGCDEAGIADRQNRLEMYKNDVERLSDDEIAKITEETLTFCKHI